MKRNILSLMAVLVMACAYAQNNAAATNLRREIAVNLAPAMRAAGAEELHIGNGAHNHGPAAHPKATPRTGSAPASRQLANNGGGQPAKKTKIKGVEYFITPCGPLLPGQICTQNGQDYVVDDYGNLQHVPTQQAPNPANNTGTATAGMTVVSPTPKLDDMYDVLADGRIVAAGPVRVEPAAGGATASTSGGQSARRPATESFTEVDCETCPGGKQKMVWSHEVNDWVPYGTTKETLKRNQALLDANGDLALLPRATEEHRMDDNYGISTVAESEHMPDPKVVAADHSGDMFTSWQGGGGGASFVATGGSGYNGAVLVSGGFPTTQQWGCYNPDPIGFTNFQARNAGTFGGRWDTLASGTFNGLGNGAVVWTP